MTTTARILTRPYPAKAATCRVVERRGLLPHNLGEWAMAAVLGALASVGLVATIEWASIALVGR